MPFSGSLAVADPVALSARYTMTPADRRLIDDQIRDLQTTIVSIAGQGAQVVFLPVSSLADIGPGQVVCLDAADGVAVTVATSTALAAAKQVRGIAVGIGLRGGRVPVVLAGAAPAILTKLSQSLWGARLLRVGADGYPALAGSYAIGAADATGTITFAPIGAGADIRASSLLVTGGSSTAALGITDLPVGIHQVDVYALAANAGNLQGASYKRSLTVRVGASSIAAIGTVADMGTSEDAGASSWDATISITGMVVYVMVTGAAQWIVTAQILSAINPNPAPPGPLPDLVSILPTSGPTAGGTSVVLTGTDFTGVTAVSFGGIAAASFTVNSSTQITAVTPALTAGAKDVSVTTPNGTDVLAGAFTASAFTLAGLAWEVWLKGSSRTSSQIAGTASAGTSGNANRKVTSTSANAIAAGTTFNALPSVDWNSDDIWSSGNFILSDIVAAGGNEFTCLMVIQVNSYTATGTAFHNIPRIFGTGGGGAYFGIGAYNDGTSGKLVVGLYDVGFKTHAATLATATKQVVAMRLTTAGVLGIKIGAGAWVNLTGVGAISSLTNFLNNFSAATPSKADCDIADFLFAKVGFSDGDVSSAQTALAATYGITL